MTQIAFAPDVFTWPADEPELIGGRCGACSAVTFPTQPSCGRCGSTEVNEERLPRRGTVKANACWFSFRQDIRQMRSTITESI